MDAAPELTLSPPANLRDLGGIAIPGGAVRAGFALRADDLSLADPASAQRLVDDGLTAIIDLRSADEVAVTGRGPLGRQQVSYHHVPFLASIGAAARTAGDSAAMLDQSTFEPMYIRMFESAAPQIVTALSIIAYAPGATAFHCAAGQDRTGVLAASLLLTLGAHDDEIVADYVATGDNSDAIVGRTRQVIAPIMDRLGLDLDWAARAAVRQEFSPRPMRGLLDHLTATYGDPLRPLRAAGLTDDLVQRLRGRALGA
ncbi:tyrosine-protein phosphatase [Aeromicrobium phragmitis]|uniref:Tyrosine-protein phosphatase n=1 Tax=Aeromicrobium phragmitis TaxID=2478914 RepID=A0A3L8PPI5_9ACTN|nr:tyrosine-protein phosphatase [Aeromicrobium phragmitis]